MVQYIPHGLAACKVRQIESTRSSLAASGRFKRTIEAGQRRLISRSDLPRVDRETPAAFAGSAGARAHRTRPRTHAALEWSQARARRHLDSRASRKCTPRV